MRDLGFVYALDIIFLDGPLVRNHCKAIVQRIRKWQANSDLLENPTFNVFFFSHIIFSIWFWKQCVWDMVIIVGKGSSTVLNRTTECLSTWCFQPWKARLHWTKSKGSHADVQEWCGNLSPIKKRNNFHRLLALGENASMRNTKQLLSKAKGLGILRNARLVCTTN